MAIIPADHLTSNSSEDRGPALFSTSISLASISFLFMMLHYYTRYFIKSFLGWDDLVMGISMVLHIIDTVILCMAVHYGAGRHAGDIAKATIEQAGFLAYLHSLFAVAVQTGIKIAIALTLLRLAVQKRFRVFIYMTTTIVILYQLGLIILVLTLCKDIRSNWDLTLPHECLPGARSVGLYIAGVLNILTDVMFAVVIPIPIVLGLKLSHQAKVLSVCIFSFGCLACIAAIVRMTYLRNYDRTNDYMWDFGIVALWIMIETDVAIIAWTVPAVRTFVQNLLNIQLLKTTPGLSERSTDSDIYPLQRVARSLSLVRACRRPWSQTEPQLKDVERYAESESVTRLPMQRASMIFVTRTTTTTIQEK